MRAFVPVVVVLVFTVAGCMSWRPASLTPELTNGAKIAVLSQLRDPGSAQFSEPFAVAEKDGSLAICGLVNGRNGFGGYAGASVFAVVRQPSGEFNSLNGQDNSVFCGLTGASYFSRTPPKEILAAQGITTPEPLVVPSDYNLKKRK